MFRRHYSDEQLLAHADGELSGWVRTRVQRHLKTCWSCRARQAKLEQHIQAFAETFGDPGYPAPSWSADSKRRFRAWQQGFERQPIELPLAPIPAARFSRLALAIVALGLAGLAALGFWHTRPAPAPAPAEVVAHLRQNDGELSRGAFHQSFRVDISQEMPRREVRSSRLEVWSDRANRRYASRWTNGVDIRVASAEEPPGRAASLLDSARDIEDPAGLERAFVVWLQSRRWQPVSLAGDAAAFLSEDGASAKVERIADSANRPMLRLTVSRQRNQVTAELVTDMDSGTWQPRIQRMRLQSPEHAVELRLTSQQSERLQPGQLTAAVFSAEIAREPIPAPLAPLSPPPSAADPAGEIAPPLSPGEVEIASRKVEVHYALHRLGVCLGEPVEVKTEASGRVVIRGLAESETRRDEIRQALRDLAFVDFQIRTVDEAAENSQAPPEGQQAKAAPRSSGNPEFEETLARYYRQSFPAAQAAAHLATLANDVTSLSSSALAQAWAIERLAKEFPPDATHGLRGAIQWDLADMLRDHGAKLRETMQSLQLALAPVVPLKAPEPEKGPAAAPEQLVEAAKRLDRLIRFLFAGAASPETFRLPGKDDLSAELSRLSETIQSWERAGVSGISNSWTRARKE